MITNVSKVAQYASKSVLEQELERRLIEAQKACDGNGRPVHLLPGALTHEALRDTLFVLLEPIDVDCRFITLGGSSLDIARAEAAFWENVALLARVVAVSVLLEQ